MKWFSFQEINPPIGMRVFVTNWHYVGIVEWTKEMDEDINEFADLVDNVEDYGSLIQDLDYWCPVSQMSLYIPPSPDELMIENSFKSFLSPIDFSLSISMIKHLKKYYSQLKKSYTNHFNNGTTADTLLERLSLLWGGEKRFCINDIIENSICFHKVIYSNNMKPRQISGYIDLKTPIVNDDLILWNELSNDQKDKLKEVYKYIYLQCIKECQD